MQCPGQDVLRGSFCHRDHVDEVSFLDRYSNLVCEDFEK